MSRVVVVDAANVVGSRPDGWWRDRAGAAARLRAALLVADLAADEVVLVLESAARGAHPEGLEGALRTVHAPAAGDDTIVAVAEQAAVAGAEVVVVSADRGLASRVAAYAEVRGPSWLRSQL